MLVWRNCVRIAIFGLGYVGVTAAACLSREGHEVLGIDPNELKVANINAGRSPIAEPGVEELIASAVKAGRIRATTDSAESLNDCAMAIVCVGTPSAADGSHNMNYIAEVSRQVAIASRDRKGEPLTVVYRSTVRPGTLEELVMPIMQESLEDADSKIELVYNPEFLRESVAVSDFFNPPKIVVGTRDGNPCKNVDEMNAGLNAPVFYTRYRVAEFTKFVDNTFHAVKVAFANEIGRVATSLEIDPQLVHKIFIADTKMNISPYYLRPGGAYGGSCLPKDVRALQYVSRDVGQHVYLIDSLIRTNEAHKQFLFEKCTKNLMPGSKVLMIGIAFKPDSDDLRESPNIDLARKLLQSGYDLAIYDPDVEPSKLLGQNLGYAFSNLPKLRKLLISQGEMESRSFDLVIDTRSWAGKFSLNSSNIVDVNKLSL
jgi:GDP-mannose 6-dehydrogenase